MKDDFEVTTPVTSAKVVLHGYVTGRMKQAIERPMYRSVQGDQSGNTSVNGEAVLESTNEAIRCLVVSVNGVTDDVLNAVLDLPEEDYEFVLGEVNKITTPLALRKPNA